MSLAAYRKWGLPRDLSRIVRVARPKREVVPPTPPVTSIPAVVTPLDMMTPMLPPPPPVVIDRSEEILDRLASLETRLIVNKRTPVVKRTVERDGQGRILAVHEMHGDEERTKYVKRDGDGRITEVIEG